MKRSWLFLISVLALTSRSFAFVLKSDVTFYLFTKENRKDYIQIDSGNADVNRDDVIVFLIHGWPHDRTQSWYEDLKDALLSRQDKNYTVIQVDWARPASQFYPISVADTPAVADIIADFIVNLTVSRGIPVRNFHLCGHSLGAQVAGFVGKTMAKRSLKLSRITALDPAGILFDSPFVSDKRKLHRTDAEVVVVVHTDGGILGTMSSSGTVDFFPNGGHAPQNGCPDNAGGSILFCDHQRSHEFFIDAIENPNTLVGTACSNYLAFIAGDCASNRQLDIGGDIVASDRGDYYLTTNPKKPYGQGPRRQCD